MILLSDTIKKRLAGQFSFEMSLDANTTVHLFKNDWTEDCDPVAGDFTEANFSGYAAIAMAGNWSSTPSYAGGAATVQGPGIATFTHNGGGTANDIYGYWLTRTSDGTFLFAEKNPAGPVTLSTNGQIYVVVPTFSIGQWDLTPCPV